eukprot:TRINITY_DN12316_c0_g1_i1.p1 TRINITY_DN12316_c0_g1~~TRINITY_DN12316_c0_g1_i1.p1  ORF type:complete len:658 (-),score=188.38 TRINITY_DN12316_c0_g1_i1:35-2008(-)
MDSADQGWTTVTKKEKTKSPNKRKEQPQQNRKDNAGTKLSAMKTGKPNTPSKNEKDEKNKVERVKQLVVEAFSCPKSSIQVFQNLQDPFNPQNHLDGGICKHEGVYYGSVLIHSVNNVDLAKPLVVFGVPKMEKRPKEFSQISSGVTSFYLSNKWNGENITAYKYPDGKGKEFVTFKPRGYPVIRDFKFSDTIQQICKALGVEAPAPAAEQSAEQPAQPAAAPATSVINTQALPETLALLKDPKIQSVSYELCGTEVSELVKYNFPTKLEPLFTTSKTGAISPIIKKTSVAKEGLSEFEAKVAELSGNIGPSPFNAGEVLKISREFRDAATDLNKKYRADNGKKRGYWYDNFVIEGKVLYLLNKNNEAEGRTLYKVKTRDTEESHFAMFDVYVQSLALQALEKLYNKVEAVTEATVRAEMDFSEKEWFRFGKDIMQLLEGIPDLTKQTYLSKQKVVVLVGVPGSGKSTLAKELIAANPSWVRVNQDELGSRKTCESKAEQALRDGKSVVVDRCNFDYWQRNTWVKLASKANVTDIRCIHIDTPTELCKERVSNREDHPTIPKGDEGPKIIDKFVDIFTPPIKAEGFADIKTVNTVEQVEEVKKALIDLIAQPDETKEKLRKSGQSTPGKEKKDKKESFAVNPFALLSGGAVEEEDDE